MLWRRYWQELRWLIVFSAVAVLALIWFALQDLPHVVAIHDAPVPGAVGPTPYHLRQEPFLQSAQGLLIAALPLTLAVCAVFFGVGGPGHERASGTALFTLALPFTRRRLVLTRFFAGFGALAALSLGALLVIAIWAAAVGMGGEFPVYRALIAGTAAVIGTTAIYSFTYLAANVTAHTVRTFATSFTLLAIAELFINRFTDRDVSQRAEVIRWFDVGRLMGAGDYLHDHGTFPWQSTAIMLGLSCLFLVVTVRWINRHDF